MKVRLVKPWATPQGVLYPGAELNVAPEVAKNLVSQMAAVSLEPAKSEAPKGR